MKTCLVLHRSHPFALHAFRVTPPPVFLREPAEHLASYIQRLLNSGYYQLVASIDVEAATAPTEQNKLLNAIYTLTNSLDYPWVDNAGKILFGSTQYIVSPKVTKCRSTDVWDIIVADNQMFWVAPVGFLSITECNDARS